MLNAYFTILMAFMLTHLFAQKDVYDIARSGTVSELKQTIKKDKTLLEKPNEDNYLPIVLAAYNNNLEVLKYMIKQGVDVNAGEGGETALLAASYKGSVNIVELLLDKGADPNIGENGGNTPLMYATFSQNITIIKLLLSRGASIHKQDKAGRSAITIAKMLENEEIIKLLNEYK